MDYTTIAKSWLQLEGIDKSTPYFLNLFQVKAFRSALSKAIDDSFEKEYIYMVTFTIDPKKHSDISASLHDEVDNYIRSQKDRSKLKLKSFEYAKELHKDGRPHWHVLIKSSASLKKSLFTYYQKKYGNIDFSQTKGKTEHEIQEYISKDSLPIKLL